ncbi:hypothetical protein GALL_504080 [mine drainage metagenome]|uniref:Uncharacterized protein n=1 Tax=mine drainage metagenome TaxID=410659 RepID=A0A1J5P9P5_9ZZZZ
MVSLKVAHTTEFRRKNLGVYLYAPLQFGLPSRGLLCGRREFPGRGEAALQNSARTLLGPKSELRTSALRGSARVETFGNANWGMN